jgi:capsular polysaccharide export protein
VFDRLASDRSGSVPVSVNGVFQELLPKTYNPPNLLPIYASPKLASHISTAWPELKFGRVRGSLRATGADHIPTKGAGLVFRAGLLRPFVEGPGARASSTIATSWKGNDHHLGLGERLLTRGDAASALLRGEAVAAAVMSHRLYGRPSASLPPIVERALTNGAVLVAGSAVAQDMATLRRLLQSHPAAKLTVLLRTPHSRLVRMARQMGIAILPAAEADAWAVISLAQVFYAPLHDDIAVLARLAGRIVFSASAEHSAPDYAPGLIAAAHLVLGTRYVDPADGVPITCEAFLDRLIEWRRLSRRVPPIACFVGISFWKRQRMAAFAGGPVQFARTARRAVALAASAGGGIAVWPSRTPAGLDQAAETAGIPLFRIEDGFIRSRGLGADFIPPASVIIDQRGIYYDARQPSDLEALLAGEDFTPDLLARARRLMELMITRRITKYNLGGARDVIAFPAGRRRILVPGQVADDLSVKAGGAGIAPGLSLLAEVRRRNPSAFIIYKPHPDVEAGHRPGAVPDAELQKIADLVVRDVDMASLIEAVDELHTVTSLAGFEALLRQRHVVTYGRPFYAGWGLTTDIHPPARRGRMLNLEQLVAATLILYPHYIDPITLLPCGPEHLIERLERAGDWRTGLLVGVRRGQGVIRRSWARSFSRGLVRRMAGVA